MGNKIGIVGYGATNNPGRNYINKSFKELAAESFYEAIRDSRINVDDIDFASFSYTGEAGIGYGAAGATMIDVLGLKNIPSYVNHANCSSGAVALHESYSMMKNGDLNVGLVCGFDKQTDIMAYENYMLLSTDADYDYKLGISHLHYFMLADQYANEHDIDPNKVKNSLVYFAKLMYENGAENPISSVYKRKINPNLFEKLPLYGNAVTPGEGSVSVIIATEEYARKNKLPYFVEIEDSIFLSSSQYIRRAYDFENYGLGHGNLLHKAYQKLFENTKLNIGDIDTFGLYDMGVNPLLTIEAAGLCPKGKAADYILEGNIDIEGTTPINTDGGNSARGHAAGPGALYQVIEICDQLLKRPKGKKIPKQISRGVINSIGGYYATVILTLFRKGELNDSIS